MTWELRGWAGRLGDDCGVVRSPPSPPSTSFLFPPFLTRAASSLSAGRGEGESGVETTMRVCTVSSATSAAVVTASRLATPHAARGRTRRRLQTTHTSGRLSNKAPESQGRFERANVRIARRAQTRPAEYTVAARELGVERAERRRAGVAPGVSHITSVTPIQRVGHPSARRAPRVLDAPPAPSAPAAPSAAAPQAGGAPPAPGLRTPPPGALPPSSRAAAPGAPAHACITV